MGKAKRRKEKGPFESKTEISIEDAVRLAVGLQQRFRLDDAEKIFRQVLSHKPDHSDALHFFGVLHHQRGKHDDAIKLISKALKHAPDYIDAHINLGNVYRAIDKFDEAEACCRRAIELSPDNVLAHNNLGSALNAKRMFFEAEKVFFKVLSLAPGFSPAYNNLGNLYSRQGEIQKAIDYYYKAVELGPKDAQSQKLLGTCLLIQGKRDQAADVFRQWLQREPDNPVPRHLLAACTGEAVPDRAPDDFVKLTFDNFASHFEERLERLEYRAPALIESAVAEAVGPSAANLDILDAGCGTGLCGPRLRPFARSLKGIDLSPGMLERADLTDCYDSLKEAELTAYIQAAENMFDLIVSADTLCYFGALLDVTTAVQGALRPGGLFVFTVEHIEEGSDTMPDGYRIGLMGRYVHSEGYVRDVLSRTGLKVKSITRDALRMELGKPVDGLVVTALK